MSNVETVQKGDKLNSPTVSNYTEKMMLKVLFEHKGLETLLKKLGGKVMRWHKHWDYPINWSKKKNYLKSWRSY